MRLLLPALGADESERSLLLSSGAFDPVHYAAQCGLSADTDLVRHYLDVGWRWGLEPRRDFDGQFLQPFYEATGMCGPPLLTWLELSARGGRLPTTRGEAEARAEVVRNSNVYDPAWYARHLPKEIDPALHYVLAGEAAGWRPSMRFDPVFYSERYPDIPAVELSPIQHYILLGERELRLPRAAAEAMAFPPAIGAKERRVVLMLVHEASRTGAPLLGWNIAAKLAEWHDMVPVILRSGPLEADFAAISAAVVGPMRWEEWHPAEMSRVAERLVETYNPLYAIANSIETSQLIPHLAMRGVPCIALVHEFASYTRPRTKLSNAFDWATDVVFPARVVADSSFKDLPHLARRQGVHILPQGRVDPPRQSARPDGNQPMSIRAGNAQDAFIVLGAGTVDIRKGVDVFIAVAAACRRQAPDLDICFIWIGGGYDPQNDSLYSTYLAEQIDRSRVAETVRMLTPVADLDPLYAASDVFLLSSRLDPQPNVAIDSLSRGLPVICFEGASGTAEVLADDPATKDLVAPHLDATGAAAIICGLARDRSRYQAMRVAVRRLADRVFNMESYTNQIDGFGRAAAARLRPEDLATLKAADLDTDMVAPPGEIVPGVDGLARVVQQQWATVGMSEDQTGNAWFRRGHAGFHPQAYASFHAAACIERGEVPLAHWLRAGRPLGQWARRVLPPLPAPAPSGARVALHGHFHYPDLLPDLLSRLDGNGTRCDLFLTTDTAAKATELETMCVGRTSGLQVSVTPNRGRDIGPFLRGLHAIASSGYDLVGHVHGKRSKLTDVAMGDRWRDFLWDNLVGPAPMLDAAAAAFVAAPQLGLVMPEDPHLVGWDGNRDIAESLAARMGLRGSLDTFFDFPLGTMFWARPQALAPLLSLDLGWDDYPPEPLPCDGTILHAIERLIPFVVRDSGWEVAGIRLPETNW